MIDKETELNRELGKPIRKLNEQQSEISKNINKMLAYGSADLGLNNVNEENYSEERIKEDLSR
jgi:ABC-type Fe3+-citrate transport system substrate-binding protein